MVINTKDIKINLYSCYCWARVTGITTYLCLATIVVHLMNDKSFKMATIKNKHKNNSGL